VVAPGQTEAVPNGIDSPAARAERGCRARRPAERQSNGERHDPRVDAAGRIVVIEGISDLLKSGIDAGQLHAGQAEQVAFEPSGVGAWCRAVRITPG
jgi:hypothetical protein